MSRAHWKVSVLAAAVAALSACGPGAPQEKVVRIAVPAPLSGDLAEEGRGLLRGVQMAVAEANEKGGLPFRLEAEPIDDQGEPKDVAPLADAIVADPSVVAVIGHYTSGCSIPAGKIYGKAGLAMITPSATNPEVTVQQNRPGWEGQRTLFRVVPSDDIQGQFAARYARKKLRLKRVAVLFEKTPYGVGLAEKFFDQFAAQGGVAASVDGLSGDDSDFDALLRHIKRESPDGLFLAAGYHLAGTLMRQARAAGLRQPIIAGDGAMTPLLFDVAGDSAGGSLVTMVGAPVDSLPGGEAFKAAWDKRYPASAIRPFDPFAYDAAQIIVDALRAAGPDRAAVSASLRKTKRQGVVGLTSFNEKGDTTLTLVTMTRVDAKAKSFPETR